MQHLTVVDHPLVQHKLSHMRDSKTPSHQLRQLLRETSHLLAYEITRNLDSATRTIETPMQEMEAPVLAGRRPALVSILRAGNGL
ncbi:MAG: uracil phosphoribosyltransferase, partial [Pseudomonadota bacterium]